MSRPVPRAAAAALLVAMLITGAWLVLGVSTERALADLIKPIVEAKSARFKASVEMKGHPRQVAEAMVLEPGRLRQELPMGMVQICNFKKRKMLMLMPLMKKAVVANFASMDAEKMPVNYFDQLRAGLLEAHQKGNAKHESLGEKEIGGRRAVGLRITTPSRATTLWSDPQTGLPIQVELTMAVFPNLKVTMTDFEFNVDLDESLFSLEPPPGYEVISTALDMSPPTEKDLLKTFREWSELADEFPDALDMQALISLILTHSTLKKGEKPTAEEMAKKPTTDGLKRALDLSTKIGRGIGFAHELPSEADAHYAGKGVKPGTPDTPIFWYRPEGSKTYRVIYADLSVRDAANAPDVPDAQPVSARSAANSQPFRLQISAPWTKPKEEQ